jgi:hypothetical protein
MNFLGQTDFLTVERVAHTALNHYDDGLVSLIAANPTFACFS